jgi:hypothetical protein
MVERNATLRFRTRVLVHLWISTALELQLAAHRPVRNSRNPMNQ